MKSENVRKLKKTMFVTFTQTKTRIHKQHININKNEKITKTITKKIFL